MWIAADFLRRRAGCFGGRGSACLLHVEKTCVPRAKFGADARCQTQLSLNSFFSLQSPPPPPPPSTHAHANSIQTPYKLSGRPYFLLAAHNRRWSTEREYSTPRKCSPIFQEFWTDSGATQGRRVRLERTRRRRRRPWPVDVAIFWHRLRRPTDCFLRCPLYAPIACRGDSSQLLCLQFSLPYW